MFSITDYVSAVQIFLTGLPEVLMRLEKNLPKPKSLADLVMAANVKKAGQFCEMEFRDGGKKERGSIRKQK